MQRFVSFRAYSKKKRRRKQSCRSLPQTVTIGLYAAAVAAVCGVSADLSALSFLPEGMFITCFFRLQLPESRRRC